MYKPQISSEFLARVSLIQLTGPSQIEFCNGEIFAKAFKYDGENVIYVV